MVHTLVSGGGQHGGFDKSQGFCMRFMIFVSQASIFRPSWYPLTEVNLMCMEPLIMIRYSSCCFCSQYWIFCNYCAYWPYCNYCAYWFFIVHVCCFTQCIRGVLRYAADAHGRNQTISFSLVYLALDFIIAIICHLLAKPKRLSFFLDYYYCNSCNYCYYFSGKCYTLDIGIA